MLSWYFPQCLGMRRSSFPELCMSKGAPGGLGENQPCAHVPGRAAGAAVSQAHTVPPSMTLWSSGDPG